jgi:hypothetical protein
MLTIIEIFFGSNSLLFHDTMYPRMNLEYTRNMHLSTFKLILNSWHLSKQRHNFSRWVFQSLTTLKSSKKKFHENTQVFLEGHTYLSLVSGWRILQTKWHDNLDEKPPNQ